MSTESTKAFAIEYGDVHVPIGEELEVYAQDADRVRILDVTQVGQEMRYRYAIVWYGNGERKSDGTDD